MRCLGSVASFLLLNGDFALANPPAFARGRFALSAKLPDFGGLVLKVLHIGWLGPGLVLALILLVTLRGARRRAYKPLQRIVRRPKLERYRGVIPRRHQDLEI